MPCPYQPQRIKLPSPSPSPIGMAVQIFFDPKSTGCVSFSYPRPLQPKADPSSGGCGRVRVSCLPSTNIHRPNSFDLSVLRRGAYRAHDINVARAHAEIAAEAGAYFVIARFCIVAQQFESREDHPRRAKAALQRMMLVKCHLQRMEFSLRPNPFNGGEFAAIGLRGEEQAGTHRAAVEQDRACAAHAMFAADVSPDQTDIVA